MYFHILYLVRSSTFLRITLLLHVHTLFTFYWIYLTSRIRTSFFVHRLSTLPNRIIYNITVSTTFSLNWTRKLMVSILIFYPSLTFFRRTLKFNINWTLVLLTGHDSLTKSSDWSKFLWEQFVVSYDNTFPRFSLYPSTCPFGNSK